jgi:hypothetical protein
MFPEMKPIYLLKKPISISGLNNAIERILQDGSHSIHDESHARRTRHELKLATQLLIKGAAKTSSAEIEV